MRNEEEEEEEKEKKKNTPTNLWTGGEESEK